mmetsp:Transcript_52700/g.111972  ORF Transcript_52700/g.111972 Transcript_52700/m.111972 type:complete len:388 (+) Transcript_52700:81-1244(+)|eukprot:CAMPEP_0172553512 /NCGR_PEP_ID=MMETSP1067-20121228/51247_1 /TAXON_ID=265564 ORGANISM="Thalassiosira punctigera, Strain Tpunct2005C2" /NCGR_SAMPLE_ID=MMETSP1067 /ASSEMBLY_ACC=CAM_ASM_000444 /LENGTH=387 /DNA_ID=CAMNT_0013341715 /DNA_START=80 /DNA_END=1243 /DNA_ORIENTATION=+
MAAQRQTKLGPVLASIVAIGFGLLLSPLSRQYPLFRWITVIVPSSIGLVPSLTRHRWAYSFEEVRSTDLRGQSALVTGGNSGIGFQICRALSRQGASVTIACRNPQRCFAAVDEIRKDDGYSGAPISPLIMDVSDLTSVQMAAKAYLQNNDNPLDMLFLNAGIASAKSEKGATQLPTTKDGIEKVFATNVVGHHLLYRLLEPALQNSTMARVVSTSSVASIWFLTSYGLPYFGNDTSSLIPSTLEKLNEGSSSFTKSVMLYGRSKLAQVAWSNALNRRLSDKSNIYVNAFHPGAVETPMVKKHISPFLPEFLVNTMSYINQRLLWTAEEGALTGIYLGVATDEIRSNNLRGRYFHPQSVEFDHPHMKDEELQENLWRLCEESVQNFL